MTEPRIVAYSDYFMEEEVESVERPAGEGWRRRRRGKRKFCVRRRDRTAADDLLSKQRRCPELIRRGIPTTE
jgi:hypothetical protein